MILCENLELICLRIAMNQQFIINDDFHLSKPYQAWTFTAIYSGSLVTFVVDNSGDLKEITQTIKFDWETRAEDWFEVNELDDESLIHI